MSAVEPLSEDERFGPSALLTPANAVTIVRMLLSPALLVLVLDEPSSWAAVSLWIALAVTDGVDGALARRFGTTRSGAFLDPLADKILVLGALFALVAAERFWLLPVALITAREIVISLFRAQLGRQGLAVPARTLAKVKTVTQEVAVGLCLLPLTEDAHWVGDSALGLAVALTVITGVQYVQAGSRATRTGGSRHTR